MSLAELNAVHGIPGHVAFVAGKNDLTRVDLSIGSASAQVYLLGATVTSFKDCTGTELIWLSDSAVFASGKAIRGGVPICWPQFGPGSLQQHGFARNSEFVVHKTEHKGSKAVSVVLRLSENQTTLAMWPFSFTLDLTVEIVMQSADQAALRMEISATNNSASDLQFTGALHAYYSIPDVRQVAISPLHQHVYFDKVLQKECVQTDELVQFEGETDRVYFGIPNKVYISGIQDNFRHFELESSGFTDVVVWNPGEAKGKTMADLSSWEHFVCVETAVVQKPIVLPPQQRWCASQLLSLQLPSSL